VVDKEFSKMDPRYDMNPTFSRPPNNPRPRDRKKNHDVNANEPDSFVDDKRW